MSDNNQSDSLDQVITSYKGFNDKWECRGFRYVVGETYHHNGSANACESGFHACEYPLDVFSYYPPATSKFAVVEQSGKVSRDTKDTKIASAEISIKAEIDIAGLVRAAIEYTIKRCAPIDQKSPASATGDRGAASATGGRGAASATGDQGAASATGDRGAASATGYRSAASATGYQGAASATGGRGAASATGVSSIAIATGVDGRAMAADGCALVLTHRGKDGEIAHIRASKVGENGIRAGVWYSLNSSGEFVEVGE